VGRGEIDRDTRMRVLHLFIFLLTIRTRAFRTPGRSSFQLHLLYFRGAQVLTAEFTGFFLSRSKCIDSLVAMTGISMFIRADTNVHPSERIGMENSVFHLIASEK
jgi:hypothetical protein